MRIRKLFETAKDKNKKLFIPYITCGDPTLSMTEEMVKELESVGADIIELGVPFSDPIADGITNQNAAARALKNNVSLKDCCGLVKKLRQESCHVPIVLFTYLNPILQIGIEEFATLANVSKIDAVLIVDLPLEESETFKKIFLAKKVGTIFLIAPTTTKERIQQSALVASEFLYCISRTGTTGVQSHLSLTMEEDLNRIRSLTELPLAIGFGISTPEQAATAAQFADGVIVGSALVKILETPDKLTAKKELIAHAKKLADAIKRY